MTEWWYYGFNDMNHTVGAIHSTLRPMDMGKHLDEYQAMVHPMNRCFDGDRFDASFLRHLREHGVPFQITKDRNIDKEFTTWLVWR